MSARFEAVFHPGCEESLPEWWVVEWEQTASGSKYGTAVWKTLDMTTGEADAKEMASVYQFEYNLEFASEYA